MSPKEFPNISKKMSQRMAPEVHQSLRGAAVPRTTVLFLTQLDTRAGNASINPQTQPEQDMLTVNSDGVAAYNLFPSIPRRVPESILVCPKEISGGLSRKHHRRY